VSTNTKPVGFPDRLRIRGGSSKAGRFLLRFLELQIPMGLGALVCFLMVRLISASSYATVYHPGTYLFTIGDVLFLTTPVAAWMIVRGYGWRSSLEMALAMLAPVAAIILLGHWGGYPYLLWLVTAGYPAMSLGMFIYMLNRRDDFTGQASHLAHGNTQRARASR
jgi:hypothetical protein